MNEPTDEQIDEIVRRVISGPCPPEGHGGLLVLAGWRAAAAPALDRLIPEQVRCPICQTFLDDANEAHDCVVAAAPAPGSDLADALAANAGVLHATIVALIAERDALRAVVRAADAMRADAYQVDVSHKDEDDFRWEDRPTAIALAYDDARAAVKGE